MSELLRKDLTVHQECSMSFCADVRTGGVNKRAASLFGRASNDSHHNSHDYPLDP